MSHRRTAALGALLTAAVACFDVASLQGGPAAPAACDGSTCDGGTATAPDSGPTPTPDAAPVCAPVEVSSFKPVWKPPNGRQQNKCSSQQIDMFVGCAGSITKACTDYRAQTANAVCADCLYSNFTDPAYGPFVILPEANTTNIAGCLSLLGFTTCAQKVQAFFQCKYVSCADGCPVTTRASLEAELACEDRAATSTCAAYEKDSHCIDALIAGGGPANACVAAPTVQDLGKFYGSLFCGP